LLMSSKYRLVFGILWLLPTPLLATASVTSITQNAETVGLYARFELTFTLSQTYDNPFDANVVDVSVTFAPPDGNSVTIPAFFYQEYDYTGGRYVNGRNPCWKARFAPSQLGQHRVSRITIVDAGGTTVIEPQATFVCVEGTQKGIIRRDARDRYYLRYAGGQPYLPIGQNVGWLPKGPSDWEHYFTSMSAVGENWTRVWMTHFYEGLTLEWSTRASSYYHGVGRLSLEMGWKLDRVMELAEQNGIAIQLVLQHHGQFSTNTDSNWSQNPYNLANAQSDGGFLKNVEDFFTDREAIRLTKNKFRYIIARWGYSHAVFAWELWNEVQYTNGWQNKPASVVAWHDEMANYVASIDPFDHLITTSSDNSGFDALWSLNKIDVVQVHHYGSETVPFFNSAASRLAGYGKPVLMAEFGVGSTGGSSHAEQNVNGMPEPYQTQLLEGLDLHNGIWSAFHLKSVAALWWFDCYIEAFDLYGQFSALANYARGEDPAACNLGKADLDTTGLPRCVLVSPGLADFYAVSTQTKFTVQADGSVPGTDKLSAWLHGSSKSTYRSDPTFNISLLAGDVLRIHVQEVSGWGNNKLRVLVDAQQVFTSSYTNGSSSFVIEVPLPAGEHVVKIENTGQDWFHISGYEFVNPTKGCLEFVGLSGKDHAYLWAHDVGSSYGRTASGVFTGVTVGLRGLNNGWYTIEFYETRGAGGIIQTSSSPAESGRLSIAFPDFSKDIAVKIRPVSEASPGQ
jgi:hypothetical protein